MPKNLKKRTAETAPTQEIPEWATETPDIGSYNLSVYDSFGGSIESIDDLTRYEYITLKQHLAKMRGIVVPEAA